MPMQYLNKLLSSFFAKKITTVDEAKDMLDKKPTYTKPASEKAKGTEYSKAQLNSLINNLFEVEI